MGAIILSTWYTWSHIKTCRSSSSTMLKKITKQHTNRFRCFQSTYTSQTYPNRIKKHFADCILVTFKGILFQISFFHPGCGTFSNWFVAVLNCRGRAILWGWKGSKLLSTLTKGRREIIKSMPYFLYRLARNKK